MFIINEDLKRFSIENNALNLACDYKNGLRTIYFNNVLTQFVSNIDESFFTLETRGKTLTSNDFEVLSVSGGKDFSHELITVLLENSESGISLRLHFLSDKKDAIEIIFQFKEDLKDETESAVTFHSPFLGGLSFCGDDKYYYPAEPAIAENGESAVKFPEESFAAGDMKLPLVVCDKFEKHGFAVSFPLSCYLKDAGASQNRDFYFTEIKNKEELENNSAELSMSDQYTDSVIFNITGLTNGWSEAFERTRKEFQENYDLSDYEKSGADWFKRCVVNGFIFLYGDSFNKKTGKIDTEKIIAEGKEFGDYNTVTLWNQYPRLGVDSRSQWDFYDDFPGGRAAIKEAIEEFHRENIKVFLPFIPWDRKEDESDSSMADKLCKLLVDTGADGVQLDTLDSLQSVFIKKLKKLQKPVVLTSQLHPKKGRALEKITSSWDEFFFPINMPKINLSRFMLPVHITPAVSRWARCEEKDELIKYAVFNGEPLVVWEDVFGRKLAFSKEQKTKIAAWKKVYFENIDVFCGDSPIPLYPTESGAVFCNLFISNNNREFIYSLYNDSSEKFSGKTLKLYKDFGQAAVAAIGTTSPYIKDNYLCCEISPKSVAQIKVTL